MFQPLDLTYHIGKISPDDERLVCIIARGGPLHCDAWNLVLESGCDAERESLKEILKKSLSDKEKIEEIQRQILREDIPHKVIYFLNGSRMECRLQDFPTELPPSLFQDSQCLISGFRMYAHQYRDETRMLKRQVRFLIDGAGFGEVNSANIRVPESYKNRGFYNEDNFVDVFIQVTAEAMREVVRRFLPPGVDLDDAFVGFRGGDEFAGVLFYDYFKDPLTVAKEILDNVEQERLRLFSELLPEDSEKLMAAGAAIQKRALLGYVLRLLEQSFSSELIFDDGVPRVAQIPVEYAEKFLNDYIHHEINARSSASEFCDYEIVKRELRKLHQQFISGSHTEQGEVLAEMFVIATEFTHVPHLELLPNQALALNYAIIDFNMEIPSTEVLAAHIKLAENQIDEQKISRTQSDLPISYTEDAQPSHSMSHTIQRLRAENETLLEIKSKYESLKDSLTPLDLANMYDQLLLSVCGDGSIEGVIRSSVTRGLSLREVFRFTRSEPVYLFKREVSGMRVLNAFLGMSGADEIIGAMVSETKKMNCPFGVIRHQGDSAILLHFHEPDQELLRISSERVQELVSHEMSKFPGVAVFSAYKLAGKKIGHSYINSEPPHYEDVGNVKDSHVILTVFTPEDKVGEILKRAS